MSCVLSPGHGPRGKGFHGDSSGAEFCIFLGFFFLGLFGVSKMEKNMKMQDEIG